MSQEPKKLSLKDIPKLSKSVLKDLKKLQGEGNTLPDILYNYRLVDGRLIRKRPRRGSFVEGERDDEVKVEGSGSGEEEIMKPEEVKNVEAETEPEVAKPPIPARKKVPESESSTQ